MTTPDLRGMLALFVRTQEGSRPIRDFRAPAFPGLQAVDRALTLPQCPRAPVGIETHLKKWNQYVSDNGRSGIEDRSVAALSWYPEVACSREFAQLLADRDDWARGRTIEGLVRSCHRSWAKSIETGALSEARRRLEAFSGRRRQLDLWRRNIGLVARPDGPERLGKFIAERMRQPKQAAEDLGLDCDSEYFHQVMRAAGAESRERAAEMSANWKYFVGTLLTWKNWTLNEFKNEFLLAARVAMHLESVPQEPLLAVARGDERLGDPRLPRNRANWAGIAEAMGYVIGWLSRADIRFFFDHVLTRRNDPHRRKELWLEYADRLRASRPALCREDWERLRSSLGRDMPDAAELDGAPPTSAFILDFGRVLAVEFSAVGNALFLYAENKAHEVVADLWAKRFQVTGLKRRPLALKRIVHKPGWQEEARAALAKYGIRP